MLTIALAKGRTAEDTLPLLEQSGWPLAENFFTSRALVFPAHSPILGELQYLLAKPMDVPTYVQYGVADLGIVGKDILLEQQSDVYELINLGTARCTLCLAGKPETKMNQIRRVATKYPRLAEAYFRSEGLSVELVELGGSIELAAVIGLADAIFDLVQTGATLAANGLQVLHECHKISARLIANRSSFRLKQDKLEPLLVALQKATTDGEGWI
ncbi:ATP phosphoribosyltransferase [Alicyclobacillus tolerans]|uniref:ATP phosphoribosyltransferase n=2 Tax=Alicyclobacillus tolerans TaxID=90970 RepID=A0ABT9LTQ2_9BACL|nr:MULTISPECIES: ATP phosphoribosyltransferase [Alicyclobacillus]MDP9727642.1 ATP phosphoribosyltransferase [Alicyclobacillus tengchongensis]QRF24066.1 ATP phosphoribosyltransferase [Alicyclobacillus sp. TC]SHJ63247.1 ATP phosphoribosyltransferase catalytic subunit [Alicyclobacillus montanus]